MSQVKWKNVIVSIVKNEAPYIVDWVTYHLSLGVDHFFIYDNGSDDGTQQQLTKFVNAGIVTQINWPMRGGQADAYNHAAKLLRDNADWIGFFDVDEFLVLHDHSNISDFLNAIGADEVLIPWRNFPYSGHAVMPGGPTMENFFWAYRIADGQLVQVKHFARANTIEKVTAHFSIISTKNVKLADGQPGRFSHAIEMPSYSGAQINHYATRSQAENSKRLLKGQVSGSSHKRLEAFQPLTEDMARRQDYDASILKHYNGYIAEHGRWLTISDYPHRFGLRQRTPMLQSSNDLVFYFAKSFGNYIQNEVDIRPNSSFKFLRPEQDGTSRDIAGFLLAYPRANLLFVVGQESTSRYFQGSIHFADFVRRFTLRCLTVERDLVISERLFEVNTAVSGGIFAFFDIEASAITKIELSGASGDILAADTIPIGRCAGSFYIPISPEMSFKINVSGSCKIRELVASYLP